MINFIARKLNDKYKRSLDKEEDKLKEEENLKNNTEKLSSVVVPTLENIEEKWHWISGSPGKSGNPGKSGLYRKSDPLGYHEYLAKKIEENISYSEYIAENLNNAIAYSDYLAEILNQNVSGSWIEGYAKAHSSVKNKKIKRIYSPEDPYGEENWEE